MNAKSFRLRVPDGQPFAYPVRLRPGPERRGSEKDDSVFKGVGRPGLGKDLEFPDDRPDRIFAALRKNDAWVIPAGKSERRNLRQDAFVVSHKSGVDGKRIRYLLRVSETQTIRINGRGRSYSHPAEGNRNSGINIFIEIKSKQDSSVRDGDAVLFRDFSDDVVLCGDVLIDFGFVTMVVGHGVINLSQCQMRECDSNVFSRSAVKEVFDHDVFDRDPRPGNHRFAAANPSLHFNSMRRRRFHAHTVLNPFGQVKTIQLPWMGFSRSWPPRGA